MKRKTEVTKPIEVGNIVYHRYFPEWGSGRVKQLVDDTAKLTFKHQDLSRNPGPVWVPLDHLRHPRKKK